MDNMDLAEEYLILGLRLEAHGQFDKAIQYYKKAYKLKPALESREESQISCRGKVYDEGGWPLFEDEDPLELKSDAETQKDENSNTENFTKSRCSKCKYPKVIAVGGPSRCGKSTLVRKYQEQTSVKCVILSQDMFFNKIIPKDDKSGYSNWEAPEAVNWKKLQDGIHSVLDQHKFPCQQHTDDEDLEDSTSRASIIFVEGHLIFQPFMMSYYDSLIFLKIDRDTCNKRRMETTPVHPFYFDEFLWPSALHQTEYALEFLKNEKEKKRLVVDGCQEAEQVLNEFANFMVQLS